MATRNFVFREEWLLFIEDLSQSQQDRVIRAIIDYAFEHELPELDQAERVAFKCIKASVDRDREKYTKRCERNRRNGNKGGRPSANDEKPTGLFGFSDETQQNPSENSEPQWVSSGVQSQSQSQSQSYSYYSFTILCPVAMQHCDETDWDSEEQQQEECILSYFFFKNWAAPGDEYRRFLAFNNTGGRSWDSYSPQEKEGAAALWKQAPPQPPRLKTVYLQFCKELYTAACASHQSHDVRMLFLADKLNVRVKGEQLSFVCSRELYEHIEKNLQVYKPTIREYMTSLNCKEFKYDLI